MTTARRQIAYRERQRRKGLVQCLVWIPERDVEAFKRMAVEMRERYEKEMEQAGRANSEG